MKRLRVSLFTAVVVMMLGVQAVHACDAILVRYESYGKYVCRNVGTTKTGACVYSCSFSPIYSV